MTDLEKFADLSLKLLGKEVHDLDSEEKNVLKSIAEHSLSSRDATDVAKTVRLLVNIYLIASPRWVALGASSLLFRSC